MTKHPQVRSLKVVYLDHTAQLSGGELALGRLLRGLPDVQATVLLGEDGPWADQLRSEGVPVEIHEIGRSGSVRKDSLSGVTSIVRGAFATAWYTWRLSRRLQAIRPDLVHTNSLKSGLYGCLAARLAGIPVVWHLRDRLAEDYLPRRAIQLTRLALRFLPSAIICNSRATEREVGRHRTETVVIPSPVGVISPAPERTTSSRGSGLTIGIVGRLAPWKGQDLFIKAFAEALRDTSATARIIGSAMFGEDEYEASLHDLVAQLGLADRIEFCGFREDIGSELEQVDILVHASRTAEPFGQVIVEGMASGLPVIAANAGGPAEIIMHDVNGLLFTPNDPRQLASCLRELSEDVGRRARLGSAGRITASTYDSATIGRSVMELYGRLVV